MDEAEVTTQLSPEMERIAEQRAKERAKSARWDIDVAVIFFSVLIIVIILMFLGVRVEVVAPVAICGLTTGWFMGWKKGKQKYKLFYDEELLKVEQESKETVKQALWERWQKLEEEIKKELEEK